MAKFIIKSVIADKTPRDIPTGVEYEFTDGLNIVFGNNEAGKSSLMKFIKNGFFKCKSRDEGRIYFQIGDTSYRADIKDKKQTDLRCKIYDENNNETDYGIIERNIVKNYFEQGFTIDLDNLSEVQKKDTSTFIDTIKDPSGEKLKEYCTNIQARIKKIFGDNNRLTKDTNELLNKINDINAQINERSTAEDKYNIAVNMLETVKKKIIAVEEEEKAFLTVLGLRSLQADIDRIIQRLPLQSRQENKSLYIEKNDYAEILKISAELDSNERTVMKNIEKITDAQNEAENKINALNGDYSLSLTKDEILSYAVNTNDLAELKKLISLKNDIKNDIAVIKAQIDSAGENLLKLNSEKKDTGIDLKGEYENLRNQLNDISENLTAYNYLTEKISVLENGMQSAKPDKKIIYILAAVCFISFVSAVFGFYYKLYAAAVLSFLSAAAALIGTVYQNRTSFDKEKLNEINEFKQQKKNIEEKLLQIINKYADGTENSLIGIKSESVKQKIQFELNNCLNTLKQIEQNNEQTIYYDEKLKILNNKLKDKQNEIHKTKFECEEIIKKANSNIMVPPENYTEFVNSIKSIQLLIKQINELKNENNTLNMQNSKLIEVLKNKREEVTSKLNGYNLAEIQDINETVNNINEKKEELLKEKDNAEFDKRSLEAFEGLNELKQKKNMLLESYRHRIYELFKQKMIMAIIENAKKEFNKNRPDLKKAQEFLSVLTGGKYTQINLDLQEIEGSGKIKKWAELSRGTKEQLYLALRLGYAYNYSKDKITMQPNGKPDLPLITDDAFVNFDETRSKNALKCLVEFSKTNQVIFFTCKGDEVIKSLNELDYNNKYNLIKL